MEFNVQGGSAAHRAGAQGGGLQGGGGLPTGAETGAGMACKVVVVMVGCKVVVDWIRVECKAGVP